MDSSVENQTTFCIAGMHRSGTSMVAKLLHGCGIFLGPENELNRPAPDNPEGYFESRQFVILNENILTKLGGTWDNPPVSSYGWEVRPDLELLVDQARTLVNQSRRTCWGWKDPRSSLTLAFWQRIIPDLKVIICLRNPLEGIQSLFMRGNVENLSQFQLWLTYYRQILAVTTPQQRLVTHYQSYFEKPREELARLLHWLTLEISAEEIDRACGSISSQLRHHSVATAELIDAGVPDEVLSLYFALCSEAGPIYQQARKNESAAVRDPTQSYIEVLLNKLEQLRETNTAREQLLEEILNSKSFKLAKFYWRLRRKK